MALITHFDLELHQMEVKMTFLNAKLTEEVYMYDIKDMEEVNYIMGIVIHCNRSLGMFGLSQKSYITNVVKQF